MQLTEEEFMNLMEQEYTDDRNDLDQPSVKSYPSLSITSSINLSDHFLEVDSKLFTIAYKMYAKLGIDLDTTEFLSKVWPIVCSHDWTISKIDQSIHDWLLIGTQNKILTRRIEHNYPQLYQFLDNNRQATLKLSIWK